jgi:adenylate cyclase
MYAARELAKQGDHDSAVPVMRKAVDDIFQARQLTYCVAGTGVLVETLLDRRAEGDVAEAQRAIDRLPNLPAGESFAVLGKHLCRTSS